jgi:hypothetical protein
MPEGRTQAAGAETVVASEADVAGEAEGAPVEVQGEA